MSSNAKREQALYDRVCKSRFDSIDDKLDHLTSLISGNGKPGINERLRTVERGRAGTARIGWIALSAAIVAVVAVIAKLLTG